MRGLPVTIRLLDPPLHEFLPKTEEEIAEVAAAMGVDAGEAPRADAGAPRVQPDARPSRLPARDLLSRRSPRCRRAPSSRRRSRSATKTGDADRAGDHGAAGRGQGRARPRQGADRQDGRRRSRRSAASRRDYTVGTMIELPRAALEAGKIAETRRVLLLRHQRPDADHLRHLARRRGVLPRRLHRARASSRPTRSSRSTATASANWSGSRPSAGGRRARTSSSASAASMAATRRRSPSARRSGSTTCPARPSACRSPASRRRRRRCAAKGKRDGGSATA